MIQLALLVEIKTMISKKWLFYFLAVLAIIIVVSSILRLLTPQPIEIPATNFVTSNHDQTSTDFEQITYQGPNFEVPNKLSIASVLPAQTTPEFSKNSLIKAFALTPHPSLENLWTSTAFALTENTDNQQLTLSSQDLSPLQGNITQEIALKVAQQFVNEYFPNLKLQPQTDSIAFLSAANEHYQQVSPDEAAQITIPYSFQIESLPVYFEHQDQLPFMVTVNSKPQIQKVVFAPQHIELTIIQTVAPISIEKALENINQLNLGSVVKAHLNDPQPLDISQLKSGRMEKVSLEYRIDSTLNLAYPFYRFTGTATNLAGKEIEVQIITPAIELQNTP